MSKKAKREFVSEVVEHLRDLASGDVQPCQLSNGLCWDLTQVLQLRWQFVGEVALRWPENAERSYHYPVPSYDSSHDQRTAYNFYRLFETGFTKWGDNPYGDARRRLCDWLADWLEDNMEELV